MTLPALAPAAQLPADLAELVDLARDFASDALAPNTKLAYRKAAKRWGEWCAAHTLDPVPATPAAVATYLSMLARDGRRVSTLEQTLAAIVYLHRTRGHGFDPHHPDLDRTMAGIRRAIGAPPVQKRPLQEAEMLRILGALPDTVSGLRDRALLLVGFAGAFRRSELAGIDLGSIGTGTGYVQTVPEGLSVRLIKSKTGFRNTDIPATGNADRCPALALARWVAEAHITRGSPVFRSVDRHGNIGARLPAESVADIVKRSVKAVGLDPTDFAGHSLRAGLATAAAAAGSDLDEIMRQTGHTNVETVRGYIRHAERFKRNAFGRLGW